jgi:hypothetical protein
VSRCVELLVFSVNDGNLERDGSQYRWIARRWISVHLN